VEIVAGLLRHPSPISIDGSEACETFLYVFKVDGQLATTYWSSTGVLDSTP